MDQTIKYLGIERYIDNLGRITIPMEYRKVLDIKANQVLQMQLVELNGEKVIVVKKVE